MLRRTLLLGLPLGLAAGPLRAEPPLPVVATFSVLADMTRQVGGARVAVTTLVGPDGDAHTYQPRPSDLRAMQAARLVVENGLGLEGWMERMVRAAGYAGPVVVATDGVVPRVLRDGPQSDAGAAADPHAWQDPRNGAIYARNIGEGLARADPAHAGEYRDRAASYARQIAETDAWVERTLAPVPEAKRRILTSHDAFGYFGARYRIEFHGVEGLDTEAEPSAAGIAALARLVRREGIKAVFVENMTNPRLSQALARETGAVIGGAVYSDALSPPGGPADSYLGMFRHNAPMFARAMLAN